LRDLNFTLRYLVASTDVSEVPSAMNVEVAGTSETLETSYQPIQRYIPEDILYSRFRAS